MFEIITDNFNIGYSQSLQLLYNKGEQTSPRGLDTIELSPFLFTLTNPLNNKLQNQVELIRELGVYKDIYDDYINRINNQLEKIITILRQDKESRKAIITIFDKEDDVNEMPCTVCFHFLIRNNKLNMNVYMRSNDALKSFQSDIFLFTTIQKYLSEQLNIDIGTYNHFCGSFHIYKKDILENHV